MSEKISIIIPIYNSEKYIEECIQSVVNQTYKNLEIILVNDGSTDASAVICEKFAAQDSRIKYLYQENKGVTAARKLGLEYATGNYVGFVDSDDYIDVDLYERLVITLSNCNKCGNQVNLLIYGAKKGYIEKEDIFGGIPQGDYSTTKDLEYVIDNMMTVEESDSIGVNPCMWCKIWDKYILKEVMDEMEDVLFLGEDMVCTYKHILRCKRIVVSDICGYHYRMREGSIVHSVNKRYLRNVDALYNALVKEYESHARNTRLMKQLNKLTSKMIAKSNFYMGLDKAEGQISYLFPRMDLVAGKRIVLYGAGRVGHGYYTLFEKTHCCKVVKWVDRNIKNDKDNEICPIESILGTEYDFIVVAVKSLKLSEEITLQLVEMGIDRQKIIWECPCE